jgi:hypothetical protein
MFDELADYGPADTAKCDECPMKVQAGLTQRHRSATTVG